MKGVAEAIMIAVCVMSIAYCTVQMDATGKDAAMRKAEICTQGGGRYDFNWGTCSYEAVK